MTQDWYSWQEFVAEVQGLMPLEKSRLIEGDDGQYLMRLIRQAVADLQHFIPSYRMGHETVYEPGDFTSEGKASISTIPPDAVLRDAWIFDTVNGIRIPCIPFPYEKRFELVHGVELTGDGQGRIAISEDNSKFYLYPEMIEGWKFSLFWNGLKADFQDADLVPFPEQATGAVADYCLGNIARYIEHDMGAYQSYLDPRTGSYILKRRLLYSSAKEQRTMRAS